MKGGQNFAAFFIFSAFMVLALSELHLCRARFHPHMNRSKVIHSCGCCCIGLIFLLIVLLVNVPRCLQVQAPV